MGPRASMKDRTLGVLRKQRPPVDGKISVGSMEEVVLGETSRSVAPLPQLSLAWHPWPSQCHPSPAPLRKAPFTKRAAAARVWALSPTG